MRFTGKRVLITGGTSGIGFAAAKQLAEEGAFVAINGRDETKGQAAAHQLAELGLVVQYVSGDISTKAGCQNIVQQMMTHWKGLDILVNSAGVYLEKPFLDLTETELDTMLNVNLKGTIYMCQAAFGEMRRQGTGVIVNVSSDAGLQGNACCTAYCAAKGGVTIFTKALAIEAIQFGVRVNCVCPGDIDTPLLAEQITRSDDPDSYVKDIIQPYPIGRIGRSEEVAKVIAFLASAESSFLVGVALPVDGGLTAC